MLESGISSREAQMLSDMLVHHPASGTVHLQEINPAKNASAFNANYPLPFGAVPNLPQLCLFGFAHQQRQAKAIGFTLVFCKPLGKYSILICVQLRNTVGTTLPLIILVRIDTHESLHI